MSKIIDKYNEYMGSKDERIEAETNRIYKWGFTALVTCCLACIYYGQMLYSVAYVYDLPVDLNPALEGPTNLLTASVLLVCLGCLIAQVRKGIFDNGRFAEVEQFPAGYCAGVAAAGALGAGVIMVGMRALAEAQLGSLASVHWGHALVIACVLVPMIFVLVMVAYWLSFRKAKANRERLASQLGD